MCRTPLLCVLLALALPALASNLRQIEITQPYLLLPVTNTPSDPWQWMQFDIDGERVRDFSVDIDAATPDLWVPVDVSEFIGKTLTIHYATAQPGALEAITATEAFPEPQDLYSETYRPQFHFTSRIGRLNDPNGLVYHNGEYHLFFQHGPYGTTNNSKHWGHAVSRDLIHWEELPTALHPDALGQIFSGSAVVDKNNTAGFQVGDSPAMVAVYTSAPAVRRHPWSLGKQRTQSIAYSNDNGRTFTKYAGNPVIPHMLGNNRDPKVFWHEPTGKWVMVLYLRKPTFAILSSPDLKHWTEESRFDLPDGHECPELFQLPLDGDAGQQLWVMWEGSGRYFIGDFDGRTFTPRGEPQQAVFGANDYAAQNFNNAPDGRMIQIAWMGRGRFAFPGMPFNQQMTIPRELTLRTTAEGPQLFINPVKELETLRGSNQHWKAFTLKDSTRVLQSPAPTELLDIELRLKPEANARCGIDVFGKRIEYNAATAELTALGKSAPLQPQADGSITLRILIDRTSLEIFANDGLRQMAFNLPMVDGNREVSVFAEGGSADVLSTNIWQMRSIWGTPPK